MVQPSTITNHVPSWVVCLLACALFISSFPAYAQVDPSKMPIALPQQAPKKTEPGRQVFFHTEDGKQMLQQDLGFIGLCFREKNPTKEQRREMYKNIRLVVSEVIDPALVEKNIYLLRLMPGATQTKWKALSKYVKSRPEIDDIRPVYMYTNEKKLKDLYVPDGLLEISFDHAPTPQDAPAIEESFPLVFVRSLPPDKALFRVVDPAIDPIDLANRIMEQRKFPLVRPVFDIVKGKPVDKDRSHKMLENLLRTAPEGEREKVKEILKKQQQKTRENLPKKK